MRAKYGILNRFQLERDYQRNIFSRNDAVVVELENFFRTYFRRFVSGIIWWDLGYPQNLLASNYNKSSRAFIDIKREKPWILKS